jgi:hypothetical protein
LAAPATRHPQRGFAAPAQARKKLGAVAVGGLVLFGGGYLTTVGNVDTVDTLDELAGNWLPVQHLSVPRFRLQAVSVGGLALFISGQGCAWACALWRLSGGSLTAR